MCFSEMCYALLYISMEHQISSKVKSIQQIVQSSVQQRRSKPGTSKKIYRLILIIAVCVLILGLGSYFLSQMGSQTQVIKRNNSEQVNATPTYNSASTSTNVPNPILVATPASATQTPSQTLINQNFDLLPEEVENIPIDVPVAVRFGVSLVAPEWVESALISPSGTIAAMISAHSPEANEPFENLEVDSPVVGTWTLRLVNRGTIGALVLLSVGIQRN